VGTGELAANRSGSVRCPSAGDGIEELQGTYGLVELAPKGMQFVDHPKLEVSNLFEPQFFGVCSKPHSKSIDVVRVGVDGPG